jgi:Ser/Thr protein kinase RdoA (MazF antagonist)
MSHPNTPTPQTELPPPLVDDICASFGLGEPIGNQRISSGVTHASYFLDTAGGSYVAKVLSYVNPDNLKNERHIQAQLDQHGIRAPQMLANEHGQFLYTGYDSNITVAQRLTGIHPARPASDDHCLSVGQTLGRFHQAVVSTTHGNERSLLARNGASYRIAKLEQRGASVAPELARLAKTNADVLFDTGLPEGVLHGDFHTENVLADGGDVAVLDLETVTTGPLVLDIGRSLADLCPRPGFARMDDQKVDRFVEGYSEVRPLTPQELDALPAAIAFGCTALAALLYVRRFDYFGNIFLQLGAAVDTQS